MFPKLMGYKGREMERESEGESNRQEISVFQKKNLYILSRKGLVR